MSIPAMRFKVVSSKFASYGGSRKIKWYFSRVQLKKDRESPCTTFARSVSSVASRFSRTSFTASFR